MKLFKSIDERLADIGLVKVKELRYRVSYRRVDASGYMQSVDLLYKATGRHIIQSYQTGCNEDGFSNCVGISMYESRLLYKKMKSKGWKVQRS